MKLEHRYTPPTIVCSAPSEQPTQRAQSSGPRHVVGYAARFWDPLNPAETQYELFPGVYERIMPTAFDKTLREDDARALWGHDTNHVLGRVSAGTLKLSVEPRLGLRYEINPPPSTPPWLLENIARDEVNGSSFGFLATDEQWSEEGEYLIRELHAVMLLEVSPVAFPAYTGTSAGLRNAVGRQGRRQYHRDRLADAPLPAYHLNLKAHAQAVAAAL